MKPVIDIHAHIFNAMDIPIQGYLKSRQDKSLPERFLCPLLSPLVARCLRRRLDPTIKTNAVTRLLCKWLLDVVCAVMGRYYRRWSHTLAIPDDQVAAELVGTFRNDGVELYVPLMLDYEYSFESTPDVAIKAQIEYMYQHIVLPYKGLIHPFAPYDPTREILFRHNQTHPDQMIRNPDGSYELEGSLNLVKEAINQKGFIGVKLYNSLGYRPLYNYAVEHERTHVPLHKSKYVFAGSEYDAVLEELYDFCVENGVPITTHCGMYGIESYNDASFDFGKAVYWRDLLSKEKYKNLHVNLGHFGWHERRGFHEPGSWVRDACEMFNEFEHLYADVSHHEITTEKYFQAYIEDYRNIVHDFPIVKERMLYGVDWHLSKRMKKFEQFKDRYVALLRNDQLFSDTETENFLGGNALRFLGMMPGDQNRERLAEFYRNEGIEPPRWFAQCGQ